MLAVAWSGGGIKTLPLQLVISIPQDSTQLHIAISQVITPKISKHSKSVRVSETSFPFTLENGGKRHARGNLRS